MFKINIKVHTDAWTILKYSSNIENVKEAVTSIVEWYAFEQDIEKAKQNIRAQFLRDQDIKKQFNGLEYYIELNITSTGKVDVIITIH